MGEHCPFGSRGAGVRPFALAWDDEGQRGFESDPRQGEVRLAESQRCRPTVSTTAVRVAEQSDHAGAVTGIGVDARERVIAPTTPFDI